MNEVILTTKQKWSVVDSMLDLINARRSRGEQPYYSDLEKYVYETFNRTTVKAPERPKDESNDL